LGIDPVLHPITSPTTNAITTMACFLNVIKSPPFFAPPKLLFRLKRL
jgi:hypothetical protein